MDTNQTPVVWKHRGPARFVVWSVAIMAVLIGLLVFVVQDRRVSNKDRLVVYCAAGIRLPVEDAAEAFTQKTGIHVVVDAGGSSGHHEGKIQIAHDGSGKHGDVYVPADESFAKRARQKGLVREMLPVARFHLVVATKSDAPVAVKSIVDLLTMPFVICEESAGAGKKAKQVLGERYTAVRAKAKAAFLTVTEAAQAVQTSRDVSAAIIWDTTARQFGLKMTELAELKGSEAQITAAVISRTARAADALAFARFLASPEHGNPSFRKHHFDPVKGDAWAMQPVINVYCGGVNRDAVLPTLKQFEQREGCRINYHFEGCGALVGKMKTGDLAMPDAFLTCETSYMTKVKEHFGPAVDMSSTEVVMLVRKGNPHGIKNLNDILGEGITVGTTDPQLSALGALSWRLFEIAGIRDRIEARQSVIVTTPTAHELVLQMEGHDKLDVALVYRANCQNLGKDLEFVPIDHPRAKAVQNVAVSQKTKYPYLTGRLLEALRTRESRRLYEDSGFDFLAASRPD